MLIGIEATAAGVLGPLSSVLGQSRSAFARDSEAGLRELEAGADLVECFAGGRFQLLLRSGAVPLGSADIDLRRLFGQVREDRDGVVGDLDESHGKRQRLLAAGSLVRKH